jgi:hypothetical protein
MRRFDEVNRTVAFASVIQFSTMGNRHCDPFFGGTSRGAKGAMHAKSALVAALRGAPP